MPWLAPAAGGVAAGVGGGTAAGVGAGVGAGTAAGVGAGTAAGVGGATAGGLAAAAPAAVPAATGLGGMSISAAPGVVGSMAPASVAPVAGMAPVATSPAIATPIQMAAPLEGGVAGSGAFSTGAPASGVNFYSTPSSLMKPTGYQLPVDASMPAPPSGFGGEFATGAPPAASPHAPGSMPHSVTPSGVEAGQPVSAQLPPREPSMVDSLRQFWDKYGEDLTEQTTKGLGEGYKRGRREDRGYAMPPPPMPQLGAAPMPSSSPLPTLEWFYGPNSRMY